MLTPETYSIVAESSLNSIASISQLNSLNNSINSCDRNIADNYIAIECLSENNCDTLVLNSCLSAASRTIGSTLGESMKNNDYIISKEITHEVNSNTYKTSNVAGAISESTYSVNHSSLVSHNILLTKDNEKSTEDDDIKLSKQTLLEEKNCDKFQSDLNCDNQENVFLEDSETSEDSVKSEFEAATAKEDSSSGSTECAETIVSFVVSSSEVILLFLFSLV